MRIATLVALAILGSCNESDPDPPPSGVDAPVGASPDSGGSSGADAATQAADGPPSNGAVCAEPGAMGNEKGVGKYCTPGGNECSGNGDATLCTVDFEASAPPFCTMICFSPGDCGSSATCESMGGLSGCAPACLTAP
jgi:hypothetical protein